MSVLSPLTVTTTLRRESKAPAELLSVGHVGDAATDHALSRKRQVSCVAVPGAPWLYASVSPRAAS
jgi:hypothetical protein